MFDHLNCPICKEEIELNPSQVPAQIFGKLAEKKAQKATIEEIVVDLCRAEGLDQRGRVAT